MKANFALSLSFDGIKLLHRAAGGWYRVGDVSLDVPDLPGALAELRAAAEALEPGGIASKLIIPDGQIKYLTIDTGAVELQDRHRAAVLALDGATPYAVDDLAFDTAPDGAQTHVAAVARETLAEAEAFAVQHGFNPILSVAIPGDAPFLGEPFFGATQHAAQVLAPDDAVEPDGISVVEIARIAPASDVDESTARPEPMPVPPRRFPREARDVEAASDAAELPDAQDAATAAPTPAIAGFASRRTGNRTGNRSGNRSEALPPLGGVTRDPAPAPASDHAQIIAASIPGLEDEPPHVPSPDAAAPAPRAAHDRMADLTTPEAAAASLRMAPPEPDQGETPQAEQPAAPAPSGFLSRRRKPAPQAQSTAADPADEKTAARAARATETQRLTVFGARKPAEGEAMNVGGKPRFLGLILTVALLIFLALVAVWAAFFLEDGVAGLFGPRVDNSAIEAAELESEPDPTDTVTASLELDPLLEMAPPPTLLQPEPAPPPPAFDADSAREFYAVSGIWTIPPKVPQAPRSVPLDNLYLTSIDRSSPSLDAVALPQPRDYALEDTRPEQVSPAPRGTSFAFDENGRVIPQPGGALSPDGFTVFSGRPPAVPPERPAPSEEDAADTPPVVDTALAQARPRARPSGLIENTERRNLGGISRAELAALRPRLRPQTEKQEEEDANEAPTDLAISTSRRPDARPGDFEQVVARVLEQRRNAPTVAPTPEPQHTAAVAPRTVAPAVPTRTSVARQATIENALNLRRVNLMGVYGKAADRRALIRLANGRYRKVKVGDRIDGGRVSAIGESELLYQKNGRNISLKMPRS